MGEAKRNSDRLVGNMGNRFGRALMLEGMGRIMRRTPVDTGRARANWNASTGSVDSSTNDAATAADVQAKAAANAGEIGRANLFDGDVGYLANGLPYIERLEDGYSGQAPSGMVKVTEAELTAWVNSQAGRFRIV